MMRAAGTDPVLFSASLLMSTRAAAPSLRVLALAAVTVPPSSGRTNAGRRVANFEKSALKEIKKYIYEQELS